MSEITCFSREDKDAFEYMYIVARESFWERSKELDNDPAFHAQPEFNKKRIKEQIVNNRRFVEDLKKRFDNIPVCVNMERDIEKTKREAARHKMEYALASQREEILKDMGYYEGYPPPSLKYFETLNWPNDTSRTEESWTHEDIMRDLEKTLEVLRERREDVGGYHERRKEPGELRKKAGHREGRWRTPKRVSVAGKKAKLGSWQGLSSKKRVKVTE